MINRLRLVHYKGFDDFTVTFGQRALLVGPNNAGKTTIIGALRICAILVSGARRRRAEAARTDLTRQRTVRGFPIQLPGGRFAMENLRYEFREAESRLELRFKNGAMLYAVWPVGEEGFYYLEHIDGAQPKTLAQVRANFGTIGIVPTLTPVEHSEIVLSADHIKGNLSTRLVSRHFRNQLYHTHAEDPSSYSGLVNFLLSNTPEIEGLELRDTYGEMGGHLLDLFFREASTHSEKEIYWVGDGLQIWLQVLFHIWRQRQLDTLVLDEPDVFLHPDLQRRLVRLLEEDRGRQVIMATHAPEMLAEAGRDTVVIVDRMRRRSRRVSDEAVLADLNDMLGSGFNLRLARALRSRVALFVEGNDMKILRNLAKVIGASRFSAELGLAIVPLEGFSNWRSAGAFAWLSTHLLGDAVRIVAILDRDYRTEERVHDVVQELADANVEAHVWRRKELESYLLVPELMARVAGVDESTMLRLLDESMEQLRNGVFARYVEERRATERSFSQHGVTIIERYILIFDALWAERADRLALVPPKDVLHLVNQKLQDCGGRTLSIRSLSARVRPEEVPSEMSDLLRRIDGYLSAGRGL